MKPNVKNKENKLALRRDIEKIQLCQNEEQFRIATQLFNSKWRNKDDSTTEFISYFNNN